MGRRHQTARERLEETLTGMMGERDTEHIMALAEMYVTEEVLDAKYRLLRRLIDDFKAIDTKGGG